MIVDSWSFSNGGTLKIDGVAYPVQRTSTGQVITVLENLSPLALTQGQMLPQVERRICDDESHPLSPFSFQTPFYKVLIDEFGEITSLFDKKHQRELIKEGGKGNRITAFEDRPMRWDAWDISEDYVHYPITFSQKPEIKLLEDGPVALIIEINLTFRQSRFIQHLYFYKTHARIDFKTEVDWHEQQVLLRTEFDLEIHASDARFDIQFGHVKRPLDQNHSYNSAMFEVCAAHWGDLSEDDYGVTLMSDDKFGYNAKGSTLGMSLIKSPTYPNEQSDQGKHNFSYSLLPHSGDAIRGLVHKHAIQMAQVPIQTEGKLRLGSFDQSWLSELPENLIIESLRRINHQEIELRLVEHFNRRGRVQLHLANSFDKIKQVSLKGEWIKTLSSGGREITLEYKPFEIITIRLFTA
jgi:alpha-mannosidase